jgi:hypothetical protein
MQKPEPKIVKGRFGRLQGIDATIATVAFFTASYIALGVMFSLAALGTQP